MAAAHGAEGANLDDISNTQLAAAIDEWIHSERDRKILKRRLIDGICYEPLADEFGISVRHMKALYQRQSKNFSGTYKALNKHLLNP